LRTVTWFPLPLLVVEVLPPAGRVGTDSLDVAVRVWRNPHFAPGRGDHQILDALHGLLVGQQLAVRSVVGETLATAKPTQSGTTDYAAAQPHEAPNKNLRSTGLDPAVQWVRVSHHDDFLGSAVLDAGFLIAAFLPRTWGFEYPARAVTTRDGGALVWIADP
jgi:hypothetical protein